MANILTIVQARMSSERLPGKCMMDICGKPMVQHVLEAAPRPVILAYPDELESEPLRALAWRLGIPHRAGQRDDVLDRFVQAVWTYHAVTGHTHRASWILRLTADCPMLTREIVDKFIDLCKQTAETPALYNKYVIYTNRPWDPDGLDMELFSIRALALANEHATDAHDREHVTPWMYRHLSVQRVSVLGRSSRPEDPGEKCSVDTQEDLDKVRRLMEERTHG